jgi:hypothetical protein
MAQEMRSLTIDNELSAPKGMALSMTNDFPRLKLIVAIHIMLWLL